MKSKCIITSNKGQHTYKLTLTGLEVIPKFKSQFVYTIDRTNIALALSAGHAGTSVDVQYVQENGKNRYLKFRTSLDTYNGYLEIGCRHFNKTATRLLLKWFGL